MITIIRFPPQVFYQSRFNVNGPQMKDLNRNKKGFNLEVIFTKMSSTKLKIVHRAKYTPSENRRVLKELTTEGLKI